MKKLTSLLAVVSVFTATGLGYVSYKNIANSNNAKEQNMLNKIKSIQKDLKNRQLELKNIQKTLTDKENRKHYLENQIKELETNINDLDGKEKISKDKINKLNADLVEINNEINVDKQNISTKETEIKNVEEENKVENKIKEIWDKDYKNKLDSAKLFSSILDEIKEKLKQNGLDPTFIKLTNSSEAKSRFRFNKKDQVFWIKLNNRLISLETGSVQKAWKPMRYRGKTWSESRLSQPLEIDASFWNDTDFVVYEIGYYDDGEQIQAIKLPKGTVKVPDQLPKEITSTKELFKNTTNFNDPSIKNWDVSNVRDMKGMFQGSKIFNQDLNTWDVSNVRTTENMFSNASKFNGDISNWSTSNVKNMSGMFSWASSFNRDLDKWNTENVQDMSGMFGSVTAFTGIFLLEIPLE